MPVFWIVWGCCWLLLVSWPLAPTLARLFTALGKMILNRPTFGAGRDAMLLRFMREAGKKLCYEDIRTMELYLYGKSFEHLGSVDGFRDRERSSYRHGYHPREWDQEFKLPPSELERQELAAKSEKYVPRWRKRKGETFTVCRYGEHGIEEVEIEL